MERLTKDWIKKQETKLLKQVVVEWIRLEVEFENIYLMDRDVDEVEPEIAWLGSLTIPSKPTFYWAKRIYERNEENEEPFLWNEYEGIAPVWDVTFSYGDLDLIIEELQKRGKYGKPTV